MVSARERARARGRSRLALAGLAANGLLLKQSEWLKIADEVPPSAAGCLLAGVIMMAVSAGAGLGHRYVSTDSLTHHITCIRLQSVDERGQLEREEMVSDLKHSARLLFASALGLGIVAVVLIFLVVLLR